MNLERLKQLRAEINANPNDKWVLLDRKEISHFLLKLELQESVLLGEGGVGRKHRDTEDDAE